MKTKLIIFISLFLISCDAESKFIGTWKGEKYMNQFFDDVIICFDGDESGYKAALRAAENSIKELKPEKQISFLFLPNNEDPDSFTNKNGKDYFIDFSKNNKISIHQFIFEHYNKETDKNPSSMAIFEKRLGIISIRAASVE